MCFKLVSGVPARSERPVLMSRTEGDHGKAFISDAGRELIPGLMDDVAVLCLARVARSMLPTLSMVCKAWRKVVRASSYPSLRQQVRSSEGWMYVLAETSASSPLAAFDPRANKWHNLPPTPGHSEQQRWQGFACVAVGCCLYLLGGVYQTLNEKTLKWNEGVVSADVKVYNAQTNTWSKIASMNAPRSWFAATVIGNRIYVAGGQGRSRFLDCAEVYDTKEEVWRPIQSMNCVRFSSSGVTLDGQFWVVAGEYMRSAREDRPRRASAEVYDPQSDSWRTVEDMWLDCDKVPGPNTVMYGRLIVIHYNKVMAYDQKTNSWMQLGHVAGGDSQNKPSSRFGFACQSLEGQLYIIGGARESWQTRHRCHVQALNSVEVCSNVRCSKVAEPRPLQWRQVADLRGSGGTVLASAVIHL